MKNFLALTLVFSLSFAPFAMAQEVPVAEVSMPAPAEIISASEPSPQAFQGGVASLEDTEADVSSVSPEEPIVQDTAMTQEAATSEVIEATTNPQDIPFEDATSTILVIDVSPAEEATSTDPLIVSQATSTPEAVPLPIEDAPLDVVAEVPAEIVPEPVSEPQPPQPSDPVIPPVTITAADLEPEPEFAFQLTGKRIAAKRIAERGASRVVEQISAPLATEVDNAKGEMRIAGACADAYYVVLIFRNQDDYANDPRSYIVNRAYPCENGGFSYAIADLPESLGSGTYYLLVGAQGQTGAWKPITELTEVTINKQ